MADIVVWHYFRHVLCSMFHQSIKRLRETAFHGFPMTAAGCWQLEASRTGRISLPICWGQEIEAGWEHGNKGWDEKNWPGKIDVDPHQSQEIPNRSSLQASTWVNILRPCFIGNLGHSSAMFSPWLIWLWDFLGHSYCSELYRLRSAADCVAGLVTDLGQVKTLQTLLIISTELVVVYHGIPISLHIT